MDVFAAIREKQAASLRRSISSTESHEARVHLTAGRATAIVRSEHPHASSPYIEEYIARDTYMTLLEDYNRRPTYAYTGAAFSARALRLWQRVVAAQRKSGVDIDTYVRAQFTFFHDAFKKAPTSLQLATDAAVVRAASVVPTKVSTNNIPASTSTAELFKSCERQMNTLMRAQKLSREEVYIQLVMTNLVMFPKTYLNADPAWRKLQESNGR